MRRNFFVALLFSLFSISVFAQVIHTDGRYHIRYDRLQYVTHTSGICRAQEFRFWLYAFAAVDVIGSEVNTQTNTSASHLSFYMWQRPTSFRMHSRISVGNNQNDETTNSGQHQKGQAPFDLNHYHAWNRGACLRQIAARYRITVDDPVYIDSVHFVGHNRNTRFICGSFPDIRIRTGRYFQGNGAAVLQILDRNGNWQNTANLSPNGSLITLRHNEVIRHVDFGQRIEFRTLKRLINNEYTAIRSIDPLFYLPKFSFPTNRSIRIEPPVCHGGNTTVRIPFEGDGSINYTLTYRRLPDDITGNAQTDTLRRENGYYVLSRNFVAGETYELHVEYRDRHPDILNTPCNFKYTFTIPAFPEFGIHRVAYVDEFEDIRNNTKYQIRNPGGTGRVSFRIENSKSANVIVRARRRGNTMYNAFSRSLTSIETTDRNTTVEGGVTYFSGTVEIVLGEGEYDEVQVLNNITPIASRCTVFYQDPVILTAPNPVNFDYAWTAPTCNNANNLVQGAVNDGSITLSNISGGANTLRYSINNSPNIDIPNNTTTATINGLTAGVHTVTILDNYGNSRSQSITISPPPAINIEITNIVLPSTACSSDGSVTVHATGGDCGSNFSFSRDGIDFTDTTNIVEGYLVGDNNRVYVRDDCGCVAAETFALIVPDALEVDTVITASPTCYEGQDGSAIIVMKNVNGVLSVDMPPTDSLFISGDTIMLFNLRAGIQTIRILDTDSIASCLFETTINIEPKLPITIDVDIIEVGDKGSETGQINIRVSGGNPGGYYISLYEDFNKSMQRDVTAFTSESHTFFNLPGEADGKFYLIYVRDTEGCYARKEIEIFEPEDVLRLFAEISQTVSCFGSSDAEITLRAEDGWGEYEYSNDGVNWTKNPVFQNLSAGTHKFYVRDKWNGTDSISITVGEPLPHSIELDSVSHVLCRGGFTGMLRYRVSGGTFPYFYSLDPPVGTITETIINGEIFVTFSNLPAGIYQFTLLDSLNTNCRLSAPIDTIKEPEQLQISILSVAHTTCELDNGILTAIATGGTAPYTFIMSNLEYMSEETLSNINEGDSVSFYNMQRGFYNITVIDSNGCTQVSSVYEIFDYRNPFVESTIVRHLVCYGQRNGSVTVISSTISTLPVVSYTMFNADSTFLVSNISGVFEDLYAGDYWIFVYDENGCRSNFPFPVRVIEPEVFAITIDAITPVVSKGEKSGQIHLRVQGGAAGSKMIYLKNLENVIVDSISVVNNLPFVFRTYAGTYYLEISDNHGCGVTTDIFTVEEPEEALHLIIVEKEDAHCKSQTGRIVVQGVGGWGDYRYRRISDGQFSSLNRFENLYAGSYLIEVTDRMGAIYRKSIVIHEPQDSLQAEIVNLQAPTCGNNGAISIRLSGGTLPYVLTNGSDTLTYSTSEIVLWQGFASGTQLFHLTDANGCRFELEVLFPETSLLKIEGFEVKHASTFDISDGKITAIVSGGIEPRSYQWSSLFELLDETGLVLDSIGSGYYVFAVTDAGGCRVEEIIYLADPNDSAFEIIKIGHETAFEAENGFAILFSDADLAHFALISERQEIFEFEKTDITQNFRIENDTIYLSNLRGGRWFFMGISDDFEHRYVTEFSINPFPEFIFSRTAVTPVAGKGDSTGIIRVEIQGGGGENTFTWTNSTSEILLSTDDEFVSVIENLPAGIYTVTAQDRFGNQISQNIEVQEPAERLTLTLVEQKNQDCKNDENAYVVLSASGGWGDYQFRHDAQIHFNNASSFTNLPTRNNYFYLIDRMGIIDTLRVEITEPEYLRANVAFVDSVKCNGNFDGSILFNITGGTPPYRFREIGTTIWTDGNLAEKKSAGWYTFVFTDSHNCIGQDTLIVYVPEPDSLLFRSIQVTHTTCNLDNGAIAVSMQGGTRPYSFSWLDYNLIEIGTDSIITDLKQNGVYRLIVTDANGCTQEFEQLINPSTLPRILQIETTEVLCYGGSTGTARVIDYVPATPFATYRFIWSNGDMGDFSPRFEAGTHHVRIEDDNGCATVFYFEITQPEPLYLNFINVREPQCYGDGNGFIGTEVFGGRGNYSYLWSTGATTSYIEHLFRGDYWVEITDGNGCVFRREIFLDQPEYKTLDLGEDISICPNNTVVIDGQDFAAHRWFTAQGDISNERFLNVNRQGTYFLEATDENGCPVWGSIFVSVGNQALIADMLLPSEANLGDTLFVVELSNMELDSIVWLYNPQEFRRITVDNEFNLPYAAHFVCLQAGVFEIGLHAFAQGCFSPVFKQIEIFETNEIRTEDWTVRQPLIILVNLYPNPTDGEFTVELELREGAEVTLTLFDISTGVPVNQKTIQAEKSNRIEYYLRELKTGTYTLQITAENERRQIKIIVR